MSPIHPIGPMGFIGESHFVLALPGGRRLQLSSHVFSSFSGSARCLRLGLRGLGCRVWDLFLSAFGFRFRVGAFLAFEGGVRVEAP